MAGTLADLHLTALLIHFTLISLSALVCFLEQQQPLSWNYREWRQIELTALPSGAAVSGYAARLPAEPHCAQVWL